ncbi:aldehyde dehydrogenase family protein, partial [Candidatus Peregrinibacteria bacterium]|nr:aldehyde dehydrogenase family protein [Candidatus Peregrinibacteria bacterium]
MQLIQFTGSHAVAQMLHATQAKKVQEHGRLDYKLQAEAGGYNPFVIAGFPRGALEPLHSFFDRGLAAPAHWDQFFAQLKQSGGTLQNFLDAVVDSTTGLQAHKCSTCKEFIVAVDDSTGDGVSSEDAAMLWRLIIERLTCVKVGPVERGGVDMGALIDRRMHDLVRAQVQRIVDEGGKLYTMRFPADVNGVMTVEGQPLAMNVAFYEVPDGELDTMDAEEVFAPVVRWNEVKGVRAAIDRAKDLGYALTATVLAPTEAEAKAIREDLPHGVVYISSDDGKVDGCTGAPAPQIPFGGSGKSGTGSAYRPGNSRYPLAFAQEVSRPRFARADWGRGKHPSPTEAHLDSVALRDPKGVLRWVQRN